MEVGSLVKSKMCLMDVRRDTIAKKLGIDASTVSRKCKNDNFSIREFKILIKTLNISNDEIIELLRR